MPSAVTSHEHLQNGAHQVTYTTCPRSPEHLNYIWGCCHVQPLAATNQVGLDLVNRAGGFNFNLRIKSHQEGQVVAKGNLVCCVFTVDALVFSQYVSSLKEIYCSKKDLRNLCPICLPVDFYLRKFTRVCNPGRPLAHKGAVLLTRLFLFLNTGEISVHLLKIKVRDLGNRIKFQSRLELGTSRADHGGSLR